MLIRSRPRVGIWTASRSKLVNLVLEEIGVDASDANAVFLRFAFGFKWILAFLEIPEHMDCNARATARELVNRSRVLQLLLNGARRRGLEKLSKAGARIGIAPAWSFDLESIELGKQQVLVG